MCLVENFRGCVTILFSGLSDDYGLVQKAGTQQSYRLQAKEMPFFWFHKNCNIAVSARTLIYYLKDVPVTSSVLSRTTDRSEGVTRKKLEWAEQL